MKSNRPIKRFSLLILLGLMGACSSNVPLEIREPLVDTAEVTQVNEAVENYISKRVRWGGVILDTSNNADSSSVTIIAMPLSDEGKPQTSEQSPGRFIAVIDEFLEPLVYAKDRLITVVGSVITAETQKVGEFPYVYPVIAVEHYYLWPKLLLPVYDHYPHYWRYDPWLYPGYPYRYYPKRLIPKHP